MSFRNTLSPLQQITPQKNLYCWLTNPDDTNIINEIATLLVNPPSSEIQVLKEFSRRFVFRIHCKNHNRTFVIKSFPFSKFREMRRYYRYGLLEFTNNQQATQNGIATPDYYCYFENRKLGFVNLNGIIMEDLMDYHSLADLVNAENSETILSMAIPIILLFFNKGINHIDLTPHNIFVCKSQSKILDWQYCSFVEPRQNEQLLFHAAHFLRYSKIEPENQFGQEWLEILWRESKCSMEKQKFIDSVWKLNSYPKIEIQHRLKLDIKKYI